MQPRTRGSRALTAARGLTCYYGVVAHILPDSGLTSCVHGTPIACRCQFCRTAAAAPAQPAPSGWSCPGCGHSYAPWVPECHHCPVPPAFIAKGSDPGPIETG